jgi:hypothetical protein
MVICKCGNTLGRGKIIGKYVCGECIYQHSADHLLYKLSRSGLDDDAEPKIAKKAKPVAGDASP